MSTSVAHESALTAANRSVEVDGATLVYRRFGNPDSGSPPLLFLQHFRGNLDTWDPAFVDGLAREREVVLLDNRGVGASTGAAPDNVEDMARDVLRFVDALDLTEIDVLGFSLGGFVAQTLALTRPRLIRRLVLACMAPQGAPDIHRWTDEVYVLASPDSFDPEASFDCSSRPPRKAAPKAWSSSAASPRGRPIATNGRT
jgi:pimeloyl-ACP methyl ester carboxylesterase